MTTILQVIAVGLASAAMVVGAVRLCRLRCHIKAQQNYWNDADSSED